jgi:SAM-dependent methyltransferase
VSTPATNAGLGERPTLDERSAYVPRARQERWIVGNLAREIPAAIERFAPRAGRALDVGCGRQPFRTLLESRGLAYEGLDTQQNADGTVAHLCAIDAPLPAPLAAARPFDFILCTEVFEHVADWHAAWSNLTALLAPGGRALITCPHVYPLHEEPYDFWRPTSFALRTFAARHGLAAVDERRVGEGWDVLGTVLAGMKPKPAGFGPVSLLAAGSARVLRAGLLALAKRRWLADAAPMATKLYLSNLIVVEKPA